ncbi:MAG: XdhC family protein [Janthinobacterium lividum]
MIERRKIVEVGQSGRAVALVTLVRVEGSSYRSEGARLVIEADGTYVGSVSGGCLEAEIVRKTQWLTRAGAVIQRYSTLFDDTAEIPYGLGCGGTVEVLLEPVDTPEFAALLSALAASLQGETRCVNTWLPTSGRSMARVVTDEQGDVIFRSAHLDVEAGGADFHEQLEPPQRLFLFGAGEDVRPMVRLAALLGWSVFVFDGRVQWARSERFPEAEIVMAMHELGDPRPGSKDAVILMTHSYEADRDWLKQVLPCQPRYLGLLGSRHRSALLVSEAAEAIGWSVSRACEHMFSPVGLDLGGDGAEAIALSAVAEIQACTQGKLAHSRRLTPDTVAEQIQLGGASRYLQTQCAL